MSLVRIDASKLKTILPLSLSLTLSAYYFINHSILLKRATVGRLIRAIAAINFTLNSRVIEAVNAKRKLHRNLLSIDVLSSLNLIVCLYVATTFIAIIISNEYLIHRNLNGNHSHRLQCIDGVDAIVYHEAGGTDRSGSLYCLAKLTRSQLNAHFRFLFSFSVFISIFSLRFPSPSEIKPTTMSIKHGINGQLQHAAADNLHVVENWISFDARNFFFSVFVFGSCAHTAYTGFAYSFQLHQTCDGSVWLSLPICLPLIFYACEWGSCCWVSVHTAHSRILYQRQHTFNLFINVGSWNSNSHTATTIIICIMLCALLHMLMRNTHSNLRTTVTPRHYYLHQTTGIHVVCGMA